MIVIESAPARAAALPCPSEDERKDWVRRGFKDPKRAYLQHAANAGARGIEFKLTFEEWWSYWKDHYHERGTRAGQFVMCRTRDAGCYEVGNVRIDTVEANATERAELYRERLSEGGTRLPGIRDRTPGSSGWMHRRSYVFNEYREDEDGEPVWDR